MSFLCVCAVVVRKNLQYIGVHILLIWRDKPKLSSCTKFSWWKSKHLHLLKYTSKYYWKLCETLISQSFSRSGSFVILPVSEPNRLARLSKIESMFSSMKRPAWMLQCQFAALLYHFSPWNSTIFHSKSGILDKSHHVYSR
jgi:hypothetical protein